MRARSVLAFGLMSGLVLGAALGWWVLSDRHNRLRAAARQAQAIAMGTERVVTLELRNIERAMTGIADDASELMATVPGQAPMLIAESIAGVVSRHREIQSIVLVDAQGTALAGGEADPALPVWIASATHGRGSRLLFGPPHQRADGQWILPLAMPMPPVEGRPPQWILTRLSIDELQTMLEGLETGREGIASIVGPGDVLLARNRPTPHDVVGTRVAGPTSRELTGDAEIPQRHSEIDGVRRVVAVRMLARYPLQAWAGLSTGEVLAPWYRLLGAITLLYLLYWAMLLLMLRILSRADHQQREMLHSIQRGREHLQLAHDTGKVGAWAMEQGSRVLAWGGDIDRLFGLEGAQITSLRAFSRRVHPQDRRVLLHRFAQAWRNDGAFSSEFRLVADDATQRWVAARGGVVQDAAGHLRMTGTLVDISERMDALTRVTDVERQFRLVFERNPLPSWIHDTHSQRFLDVNRAAMQQYGFSREQFLALGVEDICPGGLPETDDLPQGALGFEDAHLMQHRRSDGSALQARVYRSRIGFGGRDAWLVLSEDVSERLEYERELAYRARHDQTTGLLNVQTLGDRLDEGHHPGYQVVYLQLRGLQPIRDSLGREIADNVLRMLSARLQQWADEFGLVAHQPAEDFVLAIVQPQRAQQALEAMIEAVREPVGPSDGSMQRLDARFGLAVDEGNGQRAERVIDNAALAAHALESSAFAISRYDGALARRYSDRLRMVARLRQAIEQNAFELHYQPIVRVADGSVVALEALVRWPQAEGVFVAPGDFIPLCEDTGLIVPLGRWILHQAAQAQAWLQRQGCGELAVAVNVSAVQVLEGDLPGDLDSACRHAGIAPHALQMELTETALMKRPELGLAAMQALRQAGVHLSLDDFGTGFSSMCYLRHLPLSSIKLDRAFVREVDRDPRNASICRALLQLGHSMGLSMIAEGVERPEELDWLRRRGCDQVQGYLLGRPQPLEQVLQRVQGISLY